MSELSSHSLQAALQHLATASKSANVLAKSDLSPETQNAILAINREIAEAQTVSVAAYQEHVTALNRVGDLEREIAEMKDRRKECARYIAHQMDTGVTVYVQKAEMKAGKITHEACPKCFKNGEIHFLQPTSGLKHWTVPQSAWYSERNCPACGTTLSFGYVKAYGNSHTSPRSGDGSWRI